MSLSPQSLVLIMLIRTIYNKNHLTSIFSPLVFPTFRVMVRTRESVDLVKGVQNS